MEKIMKEKCFNPQRLEKLPNLYSQDEIIVPVNVNLLINDVNLDVYQQQELQSLSNRQMKFLSPLELSVSLQNQLIGLTPNLTEKKVAVLYPLQGGAIVQKNLNIENVFSNQVYIQQFAIDTKRLQPNSSPSVVLPIPLVDQLKNKQLDTILVVDDVIVTGTTIDQIKYQIYEETDEYDYSRYEQGLRFDYGEIELTRLPLEWFAASWLTYAKPKVQVKTLSVFQQIYTGIYYKGEKDQTPVNSLSTWIYDENKGQKVLTNYANKYTNNPSDFTNYVNSLKI
jgi:hypoxanthine phosphoribosyltransferase